jgi:putative flippase GtrA
MIQSGERHMSPTKVAGYRYARSVHVPAEDELAPAAAGRTGLLSRLNDRFGHLVHELGKFGIVGAASYVVDFAIFNLLWGVMPWLPAKTVSTVVAATVAFVGNKRWTWRNREHAKLTRAYTLYFLFNAVGLGISLVCLWISHDLLGDQWPDVFQTRLADNVAAMVVGMGFGTAFRFWAYRTFVFIKKADGEAPAVAESAVTSSGVV